MKMRKLRLRPHRISLTKVVNEGKGKGRFIWCDCKERKAKIGSFHFPVTKTCEYWRGK